MRPNRTCANRGLLYFLEAFLAGSLDLTVSVAFSFWTITENVPTT
jgi:hypothetical protein